MNKERGEICSQCSKEGLRIFCRPVKDQNARYAFDAITEKPITEEPMPNSIDNCPGRRK